MLRFLNLSEVSLAEITFLALPLLLLLSADLCVDHGLVRTSSLVLRNHRGVHVE